MIGLGVVCLLHADFVNSLQPVPASIPGYGLLAMTTGAFLLAIGLATASNYQLHAAGIALASLLALGIVLLHVPSAFTNPELLRSPWWIRTFEALALAGTALILAGLASDPPRERWDGAGRVAFGVSLPVFGILHFVYPQFVAALVPAWYPWPLFLAFLTGAGHFAAGIAIASGVLARAAAILAGLMYATWALTLHLPRVLDNPPARTIDNPAGYGGDRPELTSLFVCVAFWGAAWIVAGSFEERYARRRGD